MEGEGVLVVGLGVAGRYVEGDLALEDDFGGRALLPMVLLLGVWVIFFYWGEYYQLRLESSLTYLVLRLKRGSFEQNILPKARKRRIRHLSNRKSQNVWQIQGYFFTGITMRAYLKTFESINV